MGDENDYKPMGQSIARPTRQLTLDQAVRSSCASLRDQLKQILGSEPIIETLGNGVYQLATYGASRYVVVSAFSMKEFPGCCGIVVFYHASVAEDFRGKGLGKLLLTLREESARKAGYTQAYATVLESNKAELAILGAAKWESMDRFENQRTRNIVVSLKKSL